MTKLTYKALDKVLARDPSPGPVPMYEHGIDYPVIAEIMGYTDPIDLSQRSGLLEFWRRWINFYDQMGYPYVSVEMSPKFPTLNMLAGKSASDTVTRGYVNENEGVIKTLDDARDPALWKSADDVFDYALFDDILKLVPPHMKAVGGASGGPFEHATFLMGLVPFCLAIYEEPETVDVLLESISTRLDGIAERLVKREKLGIYRFGDDLGYKSNTMISVDMLKQYIFPWQKKIVGTVHKAGKKFLLHSCGQLKDVMDILIDDVGIDAKHSFEDVILPVERAKALWGDRVAIIGGIDVDFLCRADEAAIKKRTIEVLKKCSEGGGYAVGSGNTITSYMPPKNYLAMTEAVKEFNGVKG
ncbi:hypothetical protein FACS1894211_01690 [Clostridia bacterium]|nr:hypothetical protein FACS1894211_01690 [Clostridia bacterium]